VGGLGTHHPATRTRTRTRTRSQGRVPIAPQLPLP
jgi:hypothetical protein